MPVCNPEYMNLVKMKNHFCERSSYVFKLESMVCGYAFRIRFAFLFSIQGILLR